MMIDVEQLLFWKRYDGKKMYLHMCQYSQKTDGEDDSVEEWAGKLKSIKTGIEHVQRTVEESNIKNSEELKTQLEEVKEKVSTDVTSVNEKMETELKEMKDKVETEMKSMKDQMDTLKTDLDEKFNLIIQKLSGPRNLNIEVDEVVEEGASVTKNSVQISSIKIEERKSQRPLTGLARNSDVVNF